MKFSKEPLSTNSMTARTRPYIAPGPMGNLQGSYKFLDTNTWSVLKKNTLTRMIMPDSIVSKVEKGLKGKNEGADCA